MPINRYGVILTLKNKLVVRPFQRTYFTIAALDYRSYYAHSAYEALKLACQESPSKLVQNFRKGWKK